jgi:Phage capsid family./Caudovirus prohead protease.
MVDPDFSGYATKTNIECSDGRTIMPDAFKHMDKVKVPLVWQHVHNDIEQVLGHAVLEARPDGVYSYGYLNDTPQGRSAKKMVQNGDVDSLSIYANQLVERSKKVFHGFIKELSLVIAGANSGAKIDNVNLAHGDGLVTELEDEVIISMGIPFDSLAHSEEDASPEDENEEDNDSDNDQDEVVEHADGKEETLQDVFDTLTPKQQGLFDYMLNVALDEVKTKDDVTHSEKNPEENSLAHKEGIDDMGTTRNIFDQSKTDSDKKTVITHDDIKGIFEHGKKCGSFKEAVYAFVNERGLQHGIEDIEVLFPDAKTLSTTPEFDKRRTEWVSRVLGSVHKTPFARIKTISADITQDEARAKGYIKGNMKKEEWIGVSKRSTDPTTIYKKQSLDRDDILDISDFDVVMWLMGEMRLMLEEEIARAILIGDGRDVSDNDKVKDPMGASSGPGIRSIINDHEFYTTTLFVNVGDASSSYEEIVDAVMDGMEYWKGTGTPTFFTTIRELNKFKKARDADGRRLYTSNAQVAEALGVDQVVTVEPMNEIADLVGIIVNLFDYNIGTNKGGEITSFDDFDIDYNQYKYLMETRLSGALTKLKTALVIRKTTSTNVLATPTKPSFVSSTGVVTIPTVTGVVYKDAPGGTTISAGAMTALDPGESVTIYAEPASGYYFADTINDSWPFKRPAA